VTKGISLDVLYFIGVLLLAISSLLNGGFGAFFYTLATGVFAYIGIKLAYRLFGEEK